MNGRLSALIFVALLAHLADSAAAVTMDWVTVGDPGNVADTTGFGAVGVAYRISRYEVTVAQYTEFLNAVAATDTLVYYPSRSIVRSGSPGSYAYDAKPGREDMPVSGVTFYEALRFANWLHNGQGAGDTETGAYTLLGGTAIPSNGPTVTRNAGATIFLPSEDEWYKAAYFDGTRYFEYPTGADTPVVCATPGPTANTANCGSAVGDTTIVGGYTGSSSPYGTFDQGGNVWEWTEGVFNFASLHTRIVRGGAEGWDASKLSRHELDAIFPEDSQGFRVASIPEPGVALLASMAMLGLAIFHRLDT